MITPSVAVVDYGVGNLYSVQRALEQSGAAVQMVTSGAEIEAAERLVLPGVGAFADGMQGLRDRGLVKPLQRFALAGRPLLGICLGMQLLASVSEEFGEHEGLGLIPGQVRRLPDKTVDGKPQKIPHIRWCELLRPHGVQWKGTILEDTEAGSSAYLVHSFQLIPSSPEYLLADCIYGGRRVTAAVRSGKVFGAQFHPEKSGKEGLRMLSAFLRL